MGPPTSCRRVCPHKGLFGLAHSTSPTQPGTAYMYKYEDAPAIKAAAYSTLHSYRDFSCDDYIAMIESRALQNATISHPSTVLSRLITTLRVGSSKFTGVSFFTRECAAWQQDLESDLIIRLVISRSSTASVLFETSELLVKTLRTSIASCHT